MTGGAIVTTHLLTGATPAAQGVWVKDWLVGYGAKANLGQPQRHHSGYLMTNGGYSTSSDR